MRIFNLSAIIVAIIAALGTTSVIAAPQSFSKNAKVEYKPTKEVKKLAKKQEKDGWKVPFGSMPMAQQLQRAIYFQNEVDDKGEAKYAIGRAQSKAEYYDAARSQAIELANNEIAGLLETKITAEAKTILGNEQGEQLVSTIQTTKGIRTLVSQNLKQGLTVSEIYKELPDGSFMVEISRAVDRAQVEKAAKQAIREELKKRGDDILKELDKNGWDK